MEKLRHLFFVAVIVVFSQTLSAYATETIKIATLNWEPYIGENLTDEGFMAIVTREAFRRVGYEVEYVYLPWKRAIITAEAGKYDGYFPAYWSKEREKQSIFTDIITSSPIGFFKNQGRSISFKTLKNLKPYRIGVVNGFVNTPEFDAADYLTKEGVSSNLQNIRKLLRERVDLIVADKFVGFYLLSKYIPHMTGQLEFITPALQDKKLYICMSKNTKDVHEKVKAFNKGLKEIKEDGTFDKIMEKHVF